MRWSVDGELFKQALDLATLAVSRDEGQVSSCVAFTKLDSDTVSLCTSDGQFLANVPLGVEDLQGSAAFAVSLKRLYTWVSSVGADEIRIELQEKGVKASCGRAEAYFVAMDATAFPDLTKRSEGQELLLKGPVKSFVGALRFVKDSIGTETTNNTQANEFLVAEFREREFFASDTQVISLYNIEEVEGYERFSEVPIKVGKDEIPKLSRFLSKSSVDSFEIYEAQGFYLVYGEDGSAFGFAKPQQKPFAIKGLNCDLVEEEIWWLNREAFKNSFKALEATSAPGDLEVTVTLRDCPEGAKGSLKLSMANVNEQHECQIEMEVCRTKARPDAPVLTFVCNLEWMLRTLGQFKQENISLGIQLSSRARYIKFREVLPSGEVQVAYVSLKR